MNEIVYYDASFCILKIEIKNDKIVFLDRVEKLEETTAKSEVGREVINQLNEYFLGVRKEFNIPIDFKGTEFQRKVWEALIEIPYGQTRTYKEIATRVGNDKASRAVGMANNKNPIGIIVPCHRVIGSNKKLVGYAGGLDMKQGLLDLESSNK